MEEENWEEWIGFDLDGTLCKYTSGDSSNFRIGEPILPMCNMLQRYLDEGWRIKIVTARAGPHGSFKGSEERREKTIVAVKEWTKKMFGKELEVTCCKDYAMVALFDDLAVSVEANTGKLMGPLPQRIR